MGFATGPRASLQALNFDAYAAAIVVVSAIVLAAPLIALARLGVGPAQLTILAVLGAISAIDAGVALVNRGVALFVRPVPLPGLELRDGVPESLRTLVAVPTLLTTPEEIAEQVERLEIHHLASPEGDLHFALAFGLDRRATSRTRKATRRWSPSLATASIASIDATAPRPRARASCCCTVGEFGTKARGAGSAGSANAASCTN